MVRAVSFDLFKSVLWRSGLKCVWVEVCQCVSECNQDCSLSEGKVKLYITFILKFFCFLFWMYCRFSQHEGGTSSLSLWTTENWQDASPSLCLPVLTTNNFAFFGRGTWCQWMLLHRLKIGCAGIELVVPFFNRCKWIFNMIIIRLDEH